MKRIFVSMVCLTVVLMLLCLTGQTAAQKDTLVVGVQDKLRFLDPSTCYDVVGWTVLLNVYERLVVFPEGDFTHIVPQLAESWDLAEDGRTWTFHLHKGATFASGNPVNADAVIFSLSRLVKLAEGPSWLLTQFGITEESMTKIDEDTVQIVLDQQYAPSLFLSCLPSLLILDPEVAVDHEQNGDLGSEWLKHHSAGSGPYTIKERQAGGTSVVLNANTHYSGSNPPAFKRITLKHIGESAEQAALLQAGELDIAQNLTTDDIRMLGSDPAVQIFQTHGTNIIHLTMNMGYEPFASSEVRDAIRYAIDYDGIIEYVLGGAAIKHQSFILKGFLGHTPAIPYSRDVDKVRHLLAEGGYPAGFEVELRCPDFSPWLELAMKLKDDLVQIGVIVRIIPMNNEQLGDAVNRRDYQMYLWQWWYDYADTDANARGKRGCKIIRHRNHALG